MRAVGEVALYEHSHKDQQNEQKYEGNDWIIFCLFSSKLLFMV